MPLLTAVYALIGAGAAAVWMAWAFGWIIVAAVTAVAVAGAIVLEQLADSSVVRRPTTARKRYEFGSISVGVVSALVGGFAILVTIWVAARASGLPEDQKTVITAVGTVVTSLIAGLFVSAEDNDSVLGDHIRDEFRERWKGVNLPEHVEHAIFTDYEQGYTSWSRKHRKVRIDVVQKWVDEGRKPKDD